MTDSILEHARRHGPLPRMVAIQMGAYPDDWTDTDKRDSAERHLGLRYHPTCATCGGSTAVCDGCEGEV